MTWRSSSTVKHCAYNHCTCQELHMGQNPYMDSGPYEVIIIVKAHSMSQVCIETSSHILVQNSCNSNCLCDVLGLIIELVHSLALLVYSAGGKPNPLSQQIGFSMCDCILSAW